MLDGQPYEALISLRFYGRTWTAENRHSADPLSATLRLEGGFGWQATKWTDNRSNALGVARSSVGAKGDRLRMWYVYFLELANGDVYVGSTNDLKRRVGSHQMDQVASTRAHLSLARKSYAASLESRA